MDRRVPVTQVVAVASWAVCILLICAQAIMDRDVGLVGILFGLVAVAATVRHYFVKTTDT